MRLEHGNPRGSHGEDTVVELPLIAVHKLVVVQCYCVTDLRMG